MQKRIAIRTVLVLSLLASAACAVDGSEIAAPVLKWQQCGCYSSWCETGWYSSPAVADLDSDGDMEIVASAYAVVALDGETGDLLWRAKSGHDRSEDPDSVDNVGRTWPGVVIADVDNDGAIEIVTAHGRGYVSVYNNEGYFEPGWPQHPVANEFRSLAVSDLDGDGNMEIACGLARGDDTNVWVFEHNGSIRQGWPRLADGDEGSAWGPYNQQFSF
ncbi:MAG: FG-GAP repeat domain-containing protein [Candidatus Methanogasteraceae archaeon]